MSPLALQHQVKLPSCFHKCHSINSEGGDTAHDLHMICIYYNFTSGPKLSNPRCHPSLQLHPKGSQCLYIHTYRNRGFTRLCWGEILVLRYQNI